MEYVRARTPGTDHEVYLPAEHKGDETWLEEAESLLESALSYHDQALKAFRARRVPEALQQIEEALRLGAYSPRLLEAAALMALQHDDHALTHRAIAQMERFGVDEAERFRGELGQRIRRWNAHLIRPAALREKYAAADPDVSYRELLLLRDRYGEQLTSREREHLRRWHIAVPISPRPYEYQRGVFRWVWMGAVATVLGWLLGALWRR